MEKVGNCKRCGKSVFLPTSWFMKEGLCSKCKEDWEKYKEIIWLRFLDEGSTHQLVPDISMPESFDDLVKLHGKDVIKDWLRAMLD
ncbi:MAG TPA: hypothetical protein ENI23_16915 [bacterium]|nr:hypothetical protein [bacterium]